MRRTLAAAIIASSVAGVTNRGSVDRAASVAVLADRAAPATIRVGLAKPGGGYAIVEMPIETYVARVVAGEAARDSRAAALEALAITVRTFAAANLGRHRADGFDLCDQTHCQVLRAATSATERAAEATSGRLLLHDGAPASVYYSASCGGRTAIPSDVWPGHEDPPYLPSRSDDACGGAPEWTAELRAGDLARALRASGFHGGALRDMRVVSRNESGRVARLQLDGLDPRSVSGQDLRVAVGRTLGWQHIKSAAFDVRRNGDVYRFSGHGSGHGVGLCVIGSANLAEQGRTAAQILARYFPGLDVSVGSARSTASARGAAGASTRGRPANAPAAPMDETIAVSLPDEDEGERATIVRESVAARDALARALGVPAPARLTLRFHPTTGDYERATGRAWFTSGASVNGEVHLLPLATLRERGVLERTIRHELVHVMADGALAGRPAWVKEGAALYFGGEQTLPGASPPRSPFPATSRAACPSDNELVNPVSAGALANAYARARACFTRQIAAGKAWTDVR